MLNSSGINNEIFIGIDGGGTKCKAVVMSADNEIIGTGISGPGNPLHGFDQAVASITESAQLALKDAGLEHISLDSVIAGVGLAGVNLPNLYQQMSEWKNPFKQMFLATDLLIACLGSHQGSDGAVIITGTGSCGFSHVDGDSFIVGAHGFPHGDKGSGAWFGLQAAKQVLLSLDGLIAPSLMNQKVLDLLGVANGVEVVQAIAGQPATFYARMANLVFDAAEQGDVIATTIVKEGAQYISGVARQLKKRNPPRMSIIGGLTPRLKSWLDQDVQAQLSEPLSPPEAGAVLYAQQQLALS